MGQSKSRATHAARAEAAARANEQNRLAMVAADVERVRALLVLVIPVYRDIMEKPNEWVLHKMTDRCQRVQRVVAAGIGLPKSGKSTLINCFNSTLARMNFAPVPEGGAGAAAHNTLRQRRIELVKRACSAANVVNPGTFELVLCDLVGMRCQRELMCALLGKTKNGEEWPVDVKDVAAAEVERRIQAIEARPASPHDAAHGIMLVVTANTLMNLGANAATVLEMQRLAAEYTANIEGESLQLQLILVVTHVDKWAAAQGCDDSRCLLGGARGVLAPLYAEAERALGITAPNVVPLGWLNDDNIDYSRGATDPRVVVLMYLLTLLTMRCCDFYANLPINA